MTYARALHAWVGNLFPELELDDDDDDDDEEIEWQGNLKEKKKTVKMKCRTLKKQNMVEQLNQQPQTSLSLMQSPILVLKNDVNLSSLLSTTKTDVFNDNDTRIYDNNNNNNSTDFMMKLRPPPIPPTLSRTMIKINKTNTNRVNGEIPVISLKTLTKTQKSEVHLPEIKIGIRLWNPSFYDSIHSSTPSFIKVDKLQRQITVSDQKNNKISNSNNVNPSKTFSFDQIFVPEESNLDISGKLLIELIHTLINGKNSTFICIGHCREANYHCLLGNLLKKCSPSVDIEQTGLLLCAITWLFHLIANQHCTKVFVRISAQEVKDKKTSVRDLLKNEDNNNNKTASNIQYFQQQQVPSEHVVTGYVNAAQLINRAFENLTHTDDCNNTLIITIHLYQHDDEHNNNHSCLHFICLGHISEMTTHFGNILMATVNGQKHMPLYNNVDHHRCAHYLTEYIGDCHRLWLLANINVPTCQQTDILHTLQIMSKLHRTFKRTMKHKTKIHNGYLLSKSLLQRNSDLNCLPNSNASAETVDCCGSMSKDGCSLTTLEHLRKHMETVRSKQPNEVWVDGPLSKTKQLTKNEIWIDGPHEFLSTSKHREQNDVTNWKPMHTKAKVIDSSPVDSEKMRNTGDLMQSSLDNAHILSNNTVLRQRLLNDQLPPSSTPASPILLSPKRGISPFVKLNSNLNNKIHPTHLQFGCLKSEEQTASFSNHRSPMFRQNRTTDDITDDNCSTCSESVISSRCHVPQLIPLEKDPLLPFRCLTKLSPPMTRSISSVKVREDPCVQKIDIGDQETLAVTIKSGCHTLPSTYRSQRQRLPIPTTTQTTGSQSTSAAVSALVGSFYAPTTAPHQGLLMPYSSQTLPNRHSTISKSIDDDMESLQKILETLIVDKNDEKSLTRSLQSIKSTPIVTDINSTSLLETKQPIEIMSKEEKTKRLSRIVSPNRLERLQSAM
ncbi:unnamed protein product [Didymodactylos carnosus]|uniref:Kinesin motor domain-containing protein n=1 Tax=Didymodactylos carnosus TaxID=1234261 RepID=A0A8S2D8I6_9BILA|nr:unnamed protein product [Didymodactylos carnosus]CAF3613972.1 unnamed protein product [Didymodactylos carnosus]